MRTLLEVSEDALDLLQRTAQVIGDLGCEYMRLRQLGRVFQRLVFQPEDVEVATYPAQRSPRT